MPISINFKEVTRCSWYVRRPSASEQGERGQLEKGFIGIWTIQCRCRPQRMPVPFGPVIPFLRVRGA